MQGNKQSYRQWMQLIAPAVPLDLVPQISGRSRAEVMQDIQSQRMPVQTFRAQDGRVFRMVRLKDLVTQEYGKITLKGMARAMESLMDQPAANRRAA